MLGIKTLRSELKRLGATIVNETPYTDLEDATIELGGIYDGVHLSVGWDYYSVVKECANGSFLFINGDGNLRKELEEVMR